MLRGFSKALKGGSVLPIQLLAVLSTYVQSLEPSIQGTTKLGLMETGSNKYSGTY
jgi:hypothetical protein